MMRKYLLIGASAFTLGAGTMAYLSQAALADAKGKAPPLSRESLKMIELFGDVVTETKRSYVTEVDEKKLIEAAIEGMLASLDPHSSYMDLEGYNDMRDMTRGSYGGLGLEVSSDEEKGRVVQVIAPMDDAPAARAGIQAGDYIIAINGQSILGLPLSEAVEQMRGPAGEAVNLTIKRGDDPVFDVKVVREIVRPKAVTYAVHDNIGYLRLGSGFNEKTTSEAELAIRDMKSRNPQMKGFVLDLRNNPGGLLDQAVSVADLFLDGGEVVSQRGREAASIERYPARPGDILNGLPMVVLVNPGSASASEIVAGALQDRKRAEIVGLTTFGKGSVQTVIPLRGGQDGALKLTTGRYYTPSGRSIQKTGIEPDLEVAATREQAKLIADNVFQITEASQRNALNADEGKSRRGAHNPAEEPPEAFEKPCLEEKPAPASRPAPGDAKCDFQLTRALDVLRYGGVAKTPKLPTPQPAARFAEFVAPSAGRGGSQ